MRAAALRKEPLDAIARSWAGVGIPEEKKPAKEPKKARGDDSASERRSPGRAVLTVDDIRAAVASRLDGVSEVEVQILAEQLRPLAGDFREDLPEVRELLGQMTGGAKRAWSLACAVLADDARRRGDVAGFILFGVAVVEAIRQSERAALRGEDNLGAWIRQQIDYCPHQPAKLWAVAIAEAMGNSSDVFDGYDSVADTLDYQPWPGVWKSIDYSAFRKRVNRIVRPMGHGTSPANVQVTI